jgi:hypothetical protein
MLKHRCAALLIFTMLKHRCAALLIFTMLKHHCSALLFMNFLPIPKTLQSCHFLIILIAETTPSSTCFDFLPFVAETPLSATFHFLTLHH